MPRQSLPIAGRTVLVTGAARGIGAETARRLRARGARLVLVGLEPERLRSLAADLGPDAIAVEADVRDTAALTAAARAAVERFGSIDVVLANAGLGVEASAERITEAEERITMDVNVLGVMHTVRATLPHVLASRGQIIMVSSLAYGVQLPLLSAYSASKAAVHAYGNSLRLELAPRGVAVTVAYFGFIDTDLGRLAGDTGPITLMTRASPGPFSRIAPVGVAADAIVRGIERRSRRIVAPPFVWPAILLPSLLQRISERSIRDVVPQALALAEQQFSDPHSRTSQPGLQVDTTGIAGNGAAPTPRRGGEAAS